MKTNVINAKIYSQYLDPALAYIKGLAIFDACMIYETRGDSSWAGDLQS